jgi:hypothetical protein
MKIVEVYRNNGLTGLFKRSSEKVLRSTGNRLVRTADKLIGPAPLSDSDRQLLNRNRVFREKHRGQRCFILANGPSLATQDITPLEGEVTFVTNNFYKHEVLDRWQPTYYALADPHYFDGSEKMAVMLRGIAARAHGSSFFVRLKGAKEVLATQPLLPPERAYYLALAGNIAEAELSDVDLADYLPGPRNVGVLCLMLAIYMGCSPIYLLGFDHDWLANRGRSGHFYGAPAPQGNKEAQPPTGYDAWSYRMIMEYQLELWKGYEKLSQLAIQKGIRILNATNGGFLDVYERVDYAQVVGAHAQNVTSEKR